MHILTVSEASTARIRSCLNSESIEAWGKVELVVLDDWALLTKSKTQNALSLTNSFKMRGLSFQALVTVKAVPPTDATCVGDTVPIDDAPPKNIIWNEDCTASMLELASVFGSCAVNIRHTKPVPILTWLDSKKKALDAAEDPFTIAIEDVIKLNSALKSVLQLGSRHCNCIYTVPLRCTTADSNTSINATAGILLKTPDTTVGRGWCRNAKVTQWSCSLVVAFELHARQVVCAPALDHMPAGHFSHFVLLELAKVPAVQLGQKNMVSTETEDVPAAHLEQSCTLDARVRRKLYKAVTLLRRTLLTLTNDPGAQVAVTRNCAYRPT
jgi:hypothetical protein